MVNWTRHAGAAEFVGVVNMARILLGYRVLGLVDFQTRGRELRSILPEFPRLPAWTMRDCLAAKCRCSKVIGLNGR